MKARMVRKQVYLGREQDRKLKALAARRGCTEAELIREALERLPDPEGNVIEQLRAEGIIAPKPDFPDLPRGAAAKAEREELEAWLEANPENLRLSEAVDEDRGPRRLPVLDSRPATGRGWPSRGPYRRAPRVG